jgi:hypothetical protein
VRGVVDYIQDGIDAFGMRTFDRGDRIVAIVRDELVDAVRSRELLVVAACRSDDRRSPIVRDLNGEAADAAGRTQYQQLRRRLHAECVERRQSR